MAILKRETPLMKQYKRIKEKYPDALLLFRVGDFYETFGADAVKTSQILGILLTKRGNGTAAETNLAGFPYHSLNSYLPKLVNAGYRVAICDQLEDPKLAKKIVKRGVTEVVTPGVVLNDDVLQHKKNNYLAAIHFGKKEMGVSFLDISTGDFFVSQGNKEVIEQLLEKFSPSEVLVAKPRKNDFFSLTLSQYATFFIEDWVFQYEYTFEKLTMCFKTHSLEGFGIANLPEGIVAAGTILHYLSETQHEKLQHIAFPQRIINDRYVWLDSFTVKNLEIFVSHSPKGIALIDVIDHTFTSMGGRLLRKWLSFPLVKKEQIEKRHSIISIFLKNKETFENTRKKLKNIGDIERFVSKIATERINPKELVQMKKSLDEVIEIKKILKNTDSKIFKEWSHKILECEETRELIVKTLNEEAPVAVNKGNVIQKGCSEELDELRNIARSGKQYVDQMLKNEIRKTGIASLKIDFNNVFGYYIEVRNTYKNRVPQDWIRKQTLVSAERYITEELKEYEQKIMNAEEQIKILETNLYTQLLTDLKKYIPEMKTNAKEIAKIDCLAAFTYLSQKQNYTCPKFTDKSSIAISLGRHPVIEYQLPAGETYIPNDVFLDDKKQQIVMITGPNMSGKSAILRQTAQIVLLAQIGSFVPAEKAILGITDKIFTRVGASDNISMGESTFMVEMNETAAILNNITPNSLILLDEIGRGTSTYDGISIAWAIAEYLHRQLARPKTLFATHYHELNAMTEHFKRIKNYNVSVRETDKNVIFLRKLVPGGSAHSFGIHVAKMAGMPQSVLATAQKKMEALETKHTTEINTKKLQQKQKEEEQLFRFEKKDPPPDEITQEIMNIDVNTITPVEALMKINEIKRRIAKIKKHS